MREFAFIMLIANLIFGTILIAKQSYWSGFFNLMVAILIGWALYLPQDNPHPTANKADLSMAYPNYNLTVETLHAEIKAQGIQFDTIVLLQACLETGYFTSWNCTNRNNLFGYKGGIKNENNTHGYAIYRTWKESVKAYADYQRKRLNYYDLLIQWNYHEGGEGYERKCESIKKRLFKN